VDRNLNFKEHIKKVKEKIQKGRKIMYMCNKHEMAD
jgi:hypothetical protein